MSKKRSTATRRAESDAASARAAAIRAEQDRRERRRRSLAVTAVVVVVLALVLVIATVVRSSQDSSGGTATPPAGAVGRYAVPAGKASAPVKVVVYEDFMCPFCEQFESAGRTSFARDIAAGTVQFQYHVLSFLNRSSSTRYSTRSANALAVVLDASGAGVAERFHDLLFDNQPEEGGAGLSDAKLVDLAVQAGATASAVRPGIDDLAFEDWVGDVTDQASKDDVTATPTVVVDGRRLTATDTTELVAEVQKAVDAG